MKKTLLFILILMLSLTFFLTGHGQAAQLAQGANLLQNPGLEPPGSNGVAQGWQRWHRTTARQNEECLVAYHFEPKWSVEVNPAFINSGSGSQAVGNSWDTWSGGVFQTVPATPGTVYRFTFFGRGRGSNEQVPAPSETGLQINMRAGIDPNGSGVWSDSDVVWSGAGSPHDVWQPFTVEATATGNQITVFTAADWGVTGVNQCRAHLDTWFDTAELVAQTPAPPTAAPQPTAAPPVATQPPAPTAGVPTEPAAATVIATLTQTAPTETATPAGTSTVCVNAFLDTNGNGLHDPDEGYVAGITLTVAQGATIIGQAVSTGTEEPICFGDLPAGAYQVGQTLPAALEMTTQANATVNVNEGQTVGLEFGSRIRATATADTQPNATETADTAATATAAANSGNDNTTAGGTPGWLVYLGVGAILVGVVLLGVLLFMLLRR
ncbi:MAG: hypothetical protein KA586_03735 [Candidatus Promineofilum sp.]|nr:hypothetical protein [Promineifilum sp.]